MKIAYFDCFAGAAGNMILGALVDAGLPLGELERELRKLPVSGWAIATEQVRKRGQGATYLDVHVAGEDHEHGRHDVAAAHAHRKLSDVLAIVRAAGFPQAVERTASSIYTRLAEAESRVHRVPIEEIAFHEVGQIDAIIDIAGAAIGLHLLGIEQVFCSRIPCGRGSVRSAHGDLPLPAPATLELLRGVPTYAIDFDGELVTPTGAAILVTVASFAERPPMVIDRIGYGAGRSEFPFANVLRVLLGETTAAAVDGGRPSESAVQLETNIDDMNPQIFAHVVEAMFAAGALDVWLQPAQMKKGRIGTILSALAPHDRAEAVAAVVLAETTTLGVRSWVTKRVTLPRRFESVDTSFGPVRVKVVSAPNGQRARPEYDDCRAIARARGMALADVMREIEREVQAWLKKM